jgi:hypothetical protein
MLLVSFCVFCIVSFMYVFLLVLCVLPPSDNSIAVNNNNNNNTLKSCLAYLKTLSQLHFLGRMTVPVCPLPVRTALFQRTFES